MILRRVFAQVIMIKIRSRSIRNWSPPQPLLGSSRNASLPLMLVGKERCVTKRFLPERTQAFTVSFSFLVGSSDACLFV